MARICERCGHYAETGEPAPCPDCGAALKFTLLPRPGTVPPPMPGVATGVTGMHGNGPELADGGYAAPPGLFSWFLPWQYAAPIAFVTVVGTVVAIVTVVTGGK
jgi:hypothetical protein